MARASTRSQRASRPSQSQSQSQSQAQSQRASGSRRAVIEEDVEEEEEEDEEMEEQEQEHEGATQDDETDQDIIRKAHELVRLALFVEQKRATLRREEINKKVLGQSTRAFTRVFSQAQEILRETLGMELVELPSRAALEHDAHDAPHEDLNEARRAAGYKSKAATLLSKTYILRSCLDPELIERAAQTTEKLLEDEIADDLSEDEHIDNDNYDDAERPPKSYGSLLSWTKNDQLGALGILHVILSLVLVNGRVISDMDLRSNLKRLKLPSTSGRSPVHFTTTSTHRSMSTDDYLSLLLRQGYLDRQLIGEKSKNKGAGAKRVRSAQDDDSARLYEWRWGPRAMCEVGEVALAQFIAEFMLGDDEGDLDEDEAHVHRKRDEKLEKMLKGVERAAGGKLIPS